MNSTDIYMTIENLTPELRAKLRKFFEIERWHRALLTSYVTKCDHITRRCWEAAVSEVPLSLEETRIYKEMTSSEKMKMKSADH